MAGLIFGRTKRLAGFLVVIGLAFQFVLHLAFHSVMSRNPASDGVRSLRLRTVVNGPKRGDESLFGFEGVERVGEDASSTLK